MSSSDNPFCFLGCMDKFAAFTGGDSSDGGELASLFNGTTGGMMMMDSSSNSSARSLPSKADTGMSGSPGSKGPDVSGALKIFSGKSDGSSKPDSFNASTLPDMCK